MSVKPGYTMDGYKDLEAITSDLWRSGVRLGAETEAQLRTNIAYVLREVMDRSNISDILRPQEAATEFYDAVEGMVQRAEEDGLI